MIDAMFQEAIDRELDEQVKRESQRVVEVESQAEASHTLPPHSEVTPCE